MQERRREPGDPVQLMLPEATKWQLPHLPGGHPFRIPRPPFSDQIHEWTLSKAVVVGYPQ